MNEPLVKALSPDAFLPAKPDGFDEKPPSSAPGYWKGAARGIMHDPAALACVITLLFITSGAVIVPLVIPIDYAAQNVAFANMPLMSTDPSSGTLHLFGTDYLGRDIFSRIWNGARVSLIVAFAAALIDCVIGVVYGGISGYFGGRIDTIMMRILEVVSGIPYLLVVLLLMAVLPRGIGALIVAYSLVGWTGLARLVRGQVRGLRAKEFIVAARVMGAGTCRMIGRHMVPSLLDLIIVNVTLDIPNVIFTEAFLSLLGLGVPPPFPSWGAMVSEGVTVFQTQPFQLAVPALFICVTMLAFNLLGDRLQNALDPKLRREAIGHGLRARNRKPRRFIRNR